MQISPVLSEPDLQSGEYRDSNPGPPEPQSGAITNFAIPTIFCFRSFQIRMSLKGFEPPTHGLEGRCSIQLSYRLTSLNLPKKIGKQVMGIEPTYLAWKASVLPLNYTCISAALRTLCETLCLTTRRLLYTIPYKFVNNYFLKIYKFFITEFSVSLFIP